MASATAAAAPSSAASSSHARRDEPAIAGPSRSAAAAVLAAPPPPPSKLLLVSAGAFTLGLTGALILGLRRGRCLDAAEAASAVTAASTGAAAASAGPSALARRGLPASSAARPAPPAAAPEPEAPVADDPISRAANAGPLTLFRTLNSLAFSRRGSKATAPTTSIFDAPAGAQAPSVLKRARAQRAGARDELHAGPVADGSATAGAETKQQGWSPAALALGAFGAASLMVGVTATAVVVIGKRAFGIQDTDDLVSFFAELFPNGSNASVLAGLGRSARSLLSSAGLSASHPSASADEVQAGGEDLPVDEAEHSAEPESLDEALLRLDRAASEGGMRQWASVLGEQLGRERAWEVRERRRRRLERDAAAANS